MNRLPLTSIVFDAGTQIRKAIDQHVVSEYADAMTAGDSFPPLVVFHDGNQYYLADGFHRFMAAQRNTFKDIDADVRAGTKDDALWFASGANRTNGKRLTEADKKHAIVLVLKTWPERSMNQIAGQIGCSRQFGDHVRAEVAVNCNLPERVIGKDGKSYPATHKAPKRAISPIRKAVAELVAQGLTRNAIRERLKVSPGTISKVRKEMGRSGVSLAPSAIAQRRLRIQEMATEGYTSTQIAAALGMSLEGLRAKLSREAIDVPADRIVGPVKRHHANRIVEQMVMDALHLTADENLIVFAELDRSRLREWIDSLVVSRRALDAFISHLVKEQKKHEAA